MGKFKTGTCGLTAPLHLAGIFLRKRYPGTFGSGGVLAAGGAMCVFACWQEYIKRKWLNDFNAWWRRIFRVAKRQLWQRRFF
jgi:hypothetical protein